METLTNLESLVSTAERGSFYAAARLLGVTPAAVSRNIAMLERNLGTQLFRRSTRRLVLTEQGARFLDAMAPGLGAVQAAITSVREGADEPGGVLKVSMSPVFGLAHILPLVPELLRRHPALRPEWHFENRQVDLVAEGFDAAIGGGLDLASSVVSRKLAPSHLVAVASRGYLRKRRVPTEPAELHEHDGIVLRSPRTGRLHQWTMRDARGNEEPAPLTPRIVVNDPAALCEAARLDLGIAVAAIPDVLADLESGKLVRLAPPWYADAGDFRVYHSGRGPLPARTRAFVDFLVEVFRRDDLGKRFAASHHG